MRDEHLFSAHQLARQVHIPLVGEYEGDERLGGIRRAPLVEDGPGHIRVDGSWWISYIHPTL